MDSNLSLTIIMSGAFCSAEFISEFGLIPPSFLPIGNTRLFVQQMKGFSSVAGKKVISLPEEFPVSDFDHSLIQDLGFEIAFLPSTLSLSGALIKLIDLYGHKAKELRILHGDTLIRDLPISNQNVISVSTTNEYYMWGSVEVGDAGKIRISNRRPSGMSDKVLAGYFSFSHIQDFRKYLSVADSFVGAVSSYFTAFQPQLKTTDHWLDFGHLHSYYKSKARITTQRSFNDLEISPRVVKKESDDSQKMRAEANWYQSVPADLRIFTPQFLGENSVGKSGYQIEYLYLSPISDLYVFGKLPVFVWAGIFESCKEFFKMCAKHTSSSCKQISDPETLFDKTKKRLTEFAKESGTDIYRTWILNGRICPSLMQIAEIVTKLVRSSSTGMSPIVHGDFCFSNILYDFRVNSIKVIDPRGLDGAGNVSIYGDSQYDIAKLAHSVYGGYDYIIAGRYRMDIKNSYELDFSIVWENGSEEIQDLFKSMVFGQKESYDLSIRAMVVHLFLSMLPLHKDRPDRQIAFIANALRLYLEIEEEVGSL
ncbi:capsular biosynthesis protein [Bdellovibrio sp. HCB274]|uniref:capsular biosynthesis protein n=1 Tax=Bdellovibrio sp. HCB274 TaxID=3394361 RepID=UPI0039B6367A